MEKINKIFKALDENYIGKLFEEKRLIYFPEQNNKKITAIEIEKKSPGWQQETCLAKYKIFFGKDDQKIVWGASSKNESKKNAWKTMKHLFHNGFDRGQARVARPLDFINETSLLLYEEAKGIPLTTIIRGKDIKKAEESLKNAAKWISRLHGTQPETDSLSDAIFLEAGDYDRVFTDINNLMPDLKNELILASELEFINQISKEQKTLIHNDFYPGNIIVDDAVIYGIDFEKSGLGFPLTDAATLLGWFEFPVESRALNFSRNDTQNLQNIFLEAFCDLSKLDYAETRQDLNKFLAKIFLDQVYICTLLATDSWGYIGPAAKNGNREKIRELLQKAKHYISLI